MIVAPKELVMEAARSAKLNPNAVRGAGVEAEIVYPSFFCPDSSAWMKVLARLSLRNVEFRIYLLEVDAPPSDRPSLDARLDTHERSRVVVYPEFDESILTLLREIDRSEVEWLAHMADKIEWALERMRQDSEL
jgi:hypothetical protein